MINAMMQETLLTGTARKAELPGWPAAGKTGTSQDFRDAWFIGYTGHLVTGVWLGNDDSSPTRKATGGGLPVEIWSRFMRSAHQNIAVAGLPGLSGNSAFGFPLPSLPVPTAAQPSPERPAPDTRPGLDNWFLDRLFGRR
jgi:penicillin-binding protein 1A